MATCFLRLRHLLAIPAVIMLSLSFCQISQAASIPPPSTPASLHVTIQGKAYDVSSGQTLKFPTTFSNGAKGWVSYAADITSTQSTRQSRLALASSTCKTVNANQSWYNALGGVLISYTLYQYWCYDGTHVTNYTIAYDHHQEYNGWTLANDGGTTNYYPNYTPDVGVGWGNFRFDGPFGFGCKSGETVIDFYGDGTHPTIYYQDGYYGC